MKHVGGEPRYDDGASSSRQKRRERQALVNDALEHARRAVEFDQQIQELKLFEQFEMAKGYAKAAVEAYEQSTELLSRIIEEMETEVEHERGMSLPREEDAIPYKYMDGQRTKQEELRRMKGIHNKYQERINLLSVVSGIWPTPQTKSSLLSRRMDREILPEEAPRGGRHGIVHHDSAVAISKNGRVFF